MINFLRDLGPGNILLLGFVIGPVLYAWASDIVKRTQARRRGQLVDLRRLRATLRPQSPARPPRPRLVSQRVTTISGVPRPIRPPEAGPKRPS